MSGTHFPQWNYSTSVSRYVNSKSSASPSQQGEGTPNLASSCSNHEPPPPFIFQGTQCYDPPAVSPATESRFSSVHSWVGGAEQRHNGASASADSLPQSKVLRASQSRGGDHWDSIAPAGADSIGQTQMRWSGSPTDADYSQFPHQGSQMTIMDRFRLAPESIQGTSILRKSSAHFTLKRGRGRERRIINVHRDISRLLLLQLSIKQV